jgi:hypothetical protein
MPKFPIITRWGTWIKFVCYIADNYTEIKSFAKAISFSEGCSYDFYSLFTDDELVKEIKLARKYKFIAVSIKKLEDERLSTEEHILILKFVIDKINDDFLNENLSK